MSLLKKFTLKKQLSKKKSGVIAVEWTILSPLILLLVFFCIMYLIFIMDKILYSNSCSDLAQYLNMGDQGYKSTHASAPSLTSMQYEVAELSLPNHVSNGTVSTSCQPGSAELQSSYYFYLIEMLRDGRFDCPFSELQEINCKVYNGVGGSPISNFSVEPLHTESGDMVEIEVVYKFMWFNIRQKGYSFIV